MIWPVSVMVIDVFPLGSRWFAHCEAEYMLLGLAPAYCQMM